MSTAAPSPLADRELSFTRTLSASPEKLYRCWTEPALIVQWFTPPPWKTVHAEVELRPGGFNRITMRSPEGQDFPNEGVYLEVVPHRRLVWTNAFTTGWAPVARSDAPGAFEFVGVIEFEPLPDGTTRYTARVRHWTVADRDAHERMGFHAGWGIATDQLEALARTL